VPLVDTRIERRCRRGRTVARHGGARRDFGGRSRRSQSVRPGGVQAV